ncbi:major facilitator transporter [Novosphingobium sp. PP1Y]|nr:major facilitator transporter [Novosphingobium sp. PP1Y]
MPPEAAYPGKVIGRREFIAMMAMIQALQSLAFTALLPALGIISIDLQAGEPNQRQLLISVFLVSSGFSALLPGTISDRYGRKPVLLSFMAMFVVINFVSAFVRDFHLLLVLRGLLGVASSGLTVLPLAIIRDRFEGAGMAKLQATVAMLFMAVPTFAPSLGFVLLELAGWRAIFVVIAVLALGGMGWYFFRLEETLPPERRRAGRSRDLLGNVGLVLTNRESIGYVIGMALIFGGHFGFINSSQQLIAEHFGAGSAYPLIFGTMAATMALASFTNSAIVECYGARRIGHVAIFCHLAASTGQLVLASMPGETLLEFVLLMSANMCLLITVFINFTAIALQPFGHLAGAAASVQSFFRLVLGAGLGGLIGLAYDGTPRPLAQSLVLVGLLTLLLVLFSERGKLFGQAGAQSASR